MTWPAFPSPSAPSTNGFAGKYTRRQLDSIVVQILTVGSKAISADFPYSSGSVGEQIGHRFMVAPYLFPGWLSGQWVIGVGRSDQGDSVVFGGRGVSGGGGLEREPCYIHPASSHVRLLDGVVVAGQLFRG